MITKKDLIARGKQIETNNKKETTPSYKNDPIAQEINRIYDSYPLLTSPTKADQDRINDLRERMKARDYRLSQEYDANHIQTERGLTEVEQQAARFLAFSTLIKDRRWNKH
jgi:hypothetical protein